MKIALPSGRNCKYVRKKLKIFHEANWRHEYQPTCESLEFKRAMQRLFDFFQLPVPKITWCSHIPNSSGLKTLGQCTEKGEINLLTPHFHQGTFEAWLNTVYHEIGHYVLWADCETKAREFASKMVNR